MEKSSLKPGHLRRIKALALISDEQLLAFIDYIELISCRSGATLFKEGDPGNYMFFILEGQMRVYLRQQSGEVMSLRLLDPGDAFGEVALLTEAKRSACLEATMDSVLIKLSAANLHKLMAERPAVATHFLYHQARIMGRQLTDLTVQLRARRDHADLISFIQ